MIFSRDRILSTHVGSLPRNEKLSDLLMAQEEGKDYDPKALSTEMDQAVRHVVSKQMEAGIDIGNDGEQRRISFQTYVPQRMTGFGGISKRPGGHQIQGPEADHRGDYRLQQNRWRAWGVFRTLHDCTLARHHFDHHAQCVLQNARR